MINWTLVREMLPVFWDGLQMTLILLVTSAVAGLVLAVPLAVARAARSRWLAWPAFGYTYVIRGTPLLVQLYFIFYVLPDLGIRLPALTAGVIGMGLHYATYTAEVYRGGIEAVAKGQWEAAKATNLTARQTWIHVILPQAVPPMIPAMANYLLAMFKETPLLSAITVLELMNQARSVANSSYRYVEPMTMVGVMFLIVSVISVIGLRWLERHYGRVGK